VAIQNSFLDSTVKGLEVVAAAPAEEPEEGVEFTAQWLCPLALVLFPSQSHHNITQDTALHPSLLSSSALPFHRPLRLLCHLVHHAVQLRTLAKRHMEGQEHHSHQHILRELEMGL
jgi:hypothetical protein